MAILAGDLALKIFTQPIFSFLPGCSDLNGFHSLEAAIFTNVSGAKCDSGIWDSLQDGPDAGEQVGWKSVRGCVNSASLSS